MDRYFSIHDRYTIKLSDPPGHTGALIQEEFQYFTTKELSGANLEISFVEQIEIPADAVSLLHNLHYREGLLYYTETGTICFPVKDISAERMQVISERTVPKWIIFHIIEKLLTLKMVERGLCMLHSLGLEEKGTVNVYSGLQGSGKTKLALKKLRENAGYMGEEFVLIDSSATALCYPSRGINIHRFQGEEYYYLKDNPAVKDAIEKEIQLMKIWKILKSLCFIGGLREKLENRLTRKTTFVRARVSNLYPSAETVTERKIDNLFIMFYRKDSPLLISDWGIRRKTLFLLMNNNIERMESAHFLGDLMQAFLAYGDEHSIRARAYIKRILRKEYKIIGSMLRHIEHNNKRQS